MFCGRNPKLFLDGEEFHLNLSEPIYNRPPLIKAAARTTIQAGNYESAMRTGRHNFSAD
jgi:hypothetical protein